MNREFQKNLFFPIRPDLWTWPDYPLPLTRAWVAHLPVAHHPLSPTHWHLGPAGRRAPPHSTFDSHPLTCQFPSPIPIRWFLPQSPPAPCTHNRAMLPPGIRQGLTWPACAPKDSSLDRRPPSCSITQPVPRPPALRLPLPCHPLVTAAASSPDHLDKRQKGNITTDYTVSQATCHICPTNTPRLPR
jgi:hypothetical protein